MSRRYIIAVCLATVVIVCVFVLITGFPFCSDNKYTITDLSNGDFRIRLKGECSWEYEMSVYADVNWKGKYLGRLLVFSTLPWELDTMEFQCYRSMHKRYYALVEKHSAAALLLYDQETSELYPKYPSVAEDQKYEMMASIKRFLKDEHGLDVWFNDGGYVSGATLDNE